MEKTKIVTAISLVLTLFFITGCGSFQGGRDGPPVSAEFVATGSEGIVMQFVQDQPPNKVYTQSGLTFLVEVRNRGTYTVPNGMIYMTGFDPNIIFFDRVSAPIQQLEGKSPYNPEGGYTTLDFSSNNLVLPANMPNYKPTFMATACYPYQTIATPLICVDPNPLDTATDKACRVQKVYSTGSQGAPVAVQSVEAEARPNGMFFRIHIANTHGGTQQASGTVFDMASMQACPGGLQYRDLNQLEYMVSISGQPLDCDPKGKLRLVNDQAVIFCKYENIPQIPAYQTPIEIGLSYGYKSSISKIVEVENLNFAR